MSTTSLVIYLAPLWCLAVGSGVASTRAGLSKMVSKSEQGKLFSIVACLEVFMSLISSTIFNTIYKNTVYLTPSFTFYVMSCLAGVPFLLAIVLRSVSPREQYNAELDEPQQANPEKNARSNPLYDELE